MDVVLKSHTPHCAVSGRPFSDGDRVVCLLVRLQDGEFSRIDALREQADGLKAPEGEVLCRWVHTFKRRPPDADAAVKELRMTLETLFSSLYEEGELPAEENHDLIRFLALFLERRRILKPTRSRPRPGWIACDHMREKRTYLVPEGELDIAFFMRMQDKLGALLGAEGSPQA
jgi:hypothetical protein